MKRIGILNRTAKAALLLTLILAVDLRAQSQILKPHSSQNATGATPKGSIGLERAAHAEWVRGYRDGYELGFWSGIQDLRAILPPNDRPSGYYSHTKHTPYRDGYFAGYSNGYRQAFYYPWHLRR